jgi:hypothetical protein
MGRGETRCVACGDTSYGVWEVMLKLPRNKSLFASFSSEKEDFLAFLRWAART